MAREYERSLGGGGEKGLLERSSYQGKVSRARVAR